MKKLSFVSKVLTSFTICLVFSSCDSGFVDMNKDPLSYNSIIAEAMLTSTQLSTAMHSENFLVAVMQQHSTWNQGDATAAGTRYHHDWKTNFFNTIYTDQIVKSRKLLEELSESPEAVNERSIVRILQVYQFHRLTDLFGYVPYTEAAQGGEGNYTPVYDSQEFIYNDMLKELDEAAQALDINQSSFGDGDLFYQGDVTKWRKFAYSLMLRLGMRLTEVDLQTAENWVKKAITGGVIQFAEEMPYIMYFDGGQVSNRNPRANSMMTSNYNTPQNENNFLGGKMAKSFIDHLIDTNDPRLEAVAVVWVVQEDGSYVMSNDPNLQRGMAQTWTSYPPDFGTYSEPHPETLLRFDSPIIFFTAAESNLLLAEAAIRGWYIDESAEVAYNRAVQTAMKQWALYGDGYSETVLTDTRISEYMTDNPFLVSGTFEDQLNQISTQKWTSLYHTDEFEQFSNWRRTNYPSLIPVNVPGNQTGGTIPRRMVIPDVEASLNSQNYQDSVERQGGAIWNDLTGRVWWDRE